MVSLNIGIWDAVRYLSLLINVLLLLQWLKSKFVLDDFLVGRWEGTLFSDNGHGIVLTCVLYVARHKDKINTAHFYYFHVKPDSDEVVSKGLDRLETYPKNLWFIFNGEWNPTFIRLLHKSGNLPPEECDGKNNGLPLSYIWTCKASSVFFQPRLEVQIKEEKGRGGFHGTLHKV